MVEICPAILQDNVEKYKIDLEKVTEFAKRIQVDIADGVFTPNRTINLIQAYWPDDIQVDLHLMLKEPIRELETIISLKPNLAIIHAEAEGDLVAILKELKQVGIKVGVAFRADTAIETAVDLVMAADHVLVFGGTLGSYGGELDRSCLPKARAAKQINTNLEVGWDGGINDGNVREVAGAGYDVINVGGFIQKAADPQAAYAKLVQIANG